jgi:hypothetical protein
VEVKTRCPRRGERQVVGYLGQVVSVGHKDTDVLKLLSGTDPLRERVVHVGREGHWALPEAT